MAHGPHTPTGPDSTDRPPHAREAAQPRPDIGIDADTRVALHAALSTPVQREEERGLRGFRVVLSAQADIPEILARTLPRMGFAAPRKAWVGLLRALGIRPWCKYRDETLGETEAAAKAIATGKDGSGLAYEDREAWVRFRTASGDRVSLAPAPGGLTLTFDGGSGGRSQARRVLPELLRYSLSAGVPDAP